MLHFASSAGLALALILSIPSGSVQALVRLSTTSMHAGQASPAGDWGDDFEAEAINTAKWEAFSFEGDSRGSFTVAGGHLRLRGSNGARAGLRSTQEFAAGRVVVEAAVAKIGPALAAPGGEERPIGNAILTLLFDASGRNRIEWLLTNEGILEAWAVVNGEGSRLDNNNLGTKIANPTLSIARTGDEFSFALNGSVGLTRTVKGLPGSFRVMLYGFSSSENVWDSVRVRTFSPTDAAGA